MNLHYEPTSKLIWQGVYVCRHLSFGCLRKAIRENAMVANRTREIRPSGMTPGAYGNVDLKVYDSDRHVVAASSKALMKVNSGSSTRGEGN
jgi:hypothetical protein